MRRTLPVVFVCSAALLSACATRSAYQAPVLADSDQSAWNYAGDLAAVDQADAEWWRAFGDPALDQLVEQVLAANPGLAAAGFKLQQARAALGLSAIQQRPQISSSGSGQGSKPLDGGSSSESYSASLDLSYEVDLWGRLAAATDAARWEAEATEADLEATRLSLIGTTVSLYAQLAYLNERVSLAEQSLDYARRVQALVQARYDAGAESGLAPSEAERTVLNQDAELASLKQERVETLTALGVLLGRGHGADLASEPASLGELAVPVPAASTPATVLGRRPDLQAAEARLRGTLADVDATRASFYPSFSLTGSAGASSTDLAELFDNPVGTLAGALSLPFLDAQKMRLTNRQARLGYDQAEAEFRETLATALSEVENALSDRQTLTLREERLEAALTAARRSERINEVRYRSGAVGIQDWLDSQEARRTAEASVLEAQLARLNNAVTLYSALGAGVTP